MAKQLRTYIKEFKQEVVRLVESGSKSMSQVARDLGILRFTHFCGNPKPSG